MFQVPLDGQMLALIIHNSVKYARLALPTANPNMWVFGYGGIPQKYELLTVALERAGITPKMLIEIGFEAYEQPQYAWSSLWIPDTRREECVRRLAEMMKCPLRYWQKHAYPTWPPYEFITDVYI